MGGAIKLADHNSLKVYLKLYSEASKEVNPLASLIMPGNTKIPKTTAIFNMGLLLIVHLTNWGYVRLYLMVKGFVMPLSPRSHIGPLRFLIAVDKKSIGKNHRLKSLLLIS